MISQTARRVVVVGGVLMAALAGCGSEQQGSTAPQAIAPGGPVSTKDLPGVGTVLVDTAGKTLYFTDSDSASAIKCTGECTSLWIPAPAPNPAPQGNDLGVVQRPEGTSQLTYQNKPLYTFTMDSQDKPASGNEAKDSFGGVDFTWHAVVVKASTPQPPKNGGGYDGGGY